MNLALRLLSPAWKRRPSRGLKGATRWDDHAHHGGTDPVHSLRIGNARVTLDLRSGIGYEVDDAQGVLRRLGPAESRLVLLDWTRSRMPVPTPTALWVVEAAALAVEGGEPHWREWATVDLHSALVSLAHSPIEWSTQVERSLASLLGGKPPDAYPTDSTMLDAIACEAEAWVATRGDHMVESTPAPVAVHGCSEVEWDRLGRAGVDVGELGLRSAILGTVWTVSVAPGVLRRTENSSRLWARLVDRDSGTVYDEVETRLVDGAWSARGYVPPPARDAATRVDLTADLALPPRTRQARRELLVEQAWFRFLHFERRRSADPSWAMWCENYRERLAVKTSDREPSWLRPFLAEWHLRPTDLASGTQQAVSPGPCSDTPGLT